MNRRGQVVSYNDFIRSLSRRKRQRKEREVITHEIVLRYLIFMLNSHCLSIEILEH